MAKLDSIKTLYLKYLWKEGVFEKLPPTPRPIEVGVVKRPPGSWTPAELRGKSKDLITLPSTEEGDDALRIFLHELGHAFFTPTPSQNKKFWEEYQELGELLNIIEDLRVEGRMSEILGFDLGKFPPSGSEKPEVVTACNFLYILTYLHLGYEVECPSNPEGVKRAERLLRRLYRASAWSALRLARYLKEKFPNLRPPKPMDLGGAEDIRQEAPREYDSLEEPGGLLSAGREKGGVWFEQVPPPPLPPAIIKLARELFKAPEPEWMPSSVGRLVVSSYLRGDEEPFVRKEELPVVHPLIVVDVSGSMWRIREGVRALLYALYKAGLKESVLLVKDNMVKKVPIKAAYRAAFNGATEGLWACAPFISASPLAIVISDLALSDEDESKVRRSFSKKPNVYWVYWGSYKEEFLENALRLEIPRSRVIAEESLEGCLKKLAKLLRG